MKILRQFVFVCAIGIGVMFGVTKSASAGLLANPLGTTVLPQLSNEIAGKENSYLHEARRGYRRARGHNRRAYRSSRRGYRRHASRSYRGNRVRSHRRHASRGYRGKRTRYYRNHARRHYYKPRRYGYRRYSRRSYYPSFYYAAPIYYPPTVYVAPAPVVREGECAYWAQQCERNWNTKSDFIGCMKYQGCY
ncbi:MAG: hypothetical protein ACR2O0_01135 [Rhizobiaceae bacterium]